MPNDDLSMDQLLGDFEVAWNSGNRPDLLAFLNLVDAQFRADLAQRLIPIDVRFRIACGEPVSLNDYRSLELTIDPLLAEQLENLVAPPGPIGSARLVQKKIQSSAVRSDEVTFVPSTLPMPSVSSEKSPTIGPYKLLQKLGEGGMGTVWMAEQEKPIRRRVALKVIRAGMTNKQVVARFEAERQALAMMNHENIAKILDVGTANNGQPYLVMELVQGIPFNTWCDNNKLSIRERLELFIPVCKAIQHAHQKGIIHRDLKPSNVLVCLYDGRPVPKVIDFGLAKAMEPNIKLTDKTMFTEFGQVVGTLQYMSPEQAEMNQLDIDTRTDIYSLGVMLYELLTGSTPIDKQTLKSEAVYKILESIRESDPPRPSARLSSITQDAVTGISAQRKIDERKLKDILRGELDWIVMKSIEKDRTRRYETAIDFAEDIQRHLNNEVVKARPPSRRYRVEKYVRKHKGLVASLCVFALLLMAATAISSWFAYQANSARLFAENKTHEALQEKQIAIEERTKADEARKLASENEELARQKSEDALEESRRAKRQLVRYYIANGIRFSEDKAPWEALSWYARAWESEPDKNPRTESAYRMRLGSVIADAPRLAAVFFHEKMVFDAVLSPDGRRLVTLPQQDEAWLYEVHSQTPIARLKHDGTVLAAAFSPDGKTIVTGGNDKTLRFWDSENGESLGINFNLKGEVRSIDFHPHLPLIATAAGEVTIFDRKTGKQTTIEPPPASPWHVKFSPAGDKLLIAYQAQAGVWTTSDWKPIHEGISHTGLAVSSMLGHLKKRTASRDKPFPSFAPDSDKLSVFGANGPEIVDLSTGKRTLVTQQAQGINSACFSPDGKSLLVCGYDQKVSVYDIENGSLTCSFETPRAVLQAAWHPSLPIIIATSAGGVTHLINTVTGKSIAPQLKHAVSTSRVNFTPDGSRALIADLDGTVRLWDLVGVSSTEPIHPSHVPARSPSLSPDGKMRAKVAMDSAGVVLVDAQTGATVAKTSGLDEVSESLAHSQNVVYSPSGKSVLTISRSDVNVWDSSGCNPIARLTDVIQQDDPKSWLKLSQDGSRFMTVDDSENIRVYETSSGKAIGPTTPAGNIGLRVVSLSPDGTKWAMGGNNSQVDVFETASGTKLVTVTHRGYISDIAFSPDSSLVATASLDNTCRVWEVRSGQPISPPLRHDGYVWSARFNSNGLQIATIGKDNLIRLWDPHTGQPLMTPIACSGSFIEFSSAGDSIFYIGPDGIHKRLKFPIYDGSANNINYLARLFTGRYVDDTDGFTEVKQTEFTSQLASYRSAWFEYQGRPVPHLPETPSASRTAFQTPIEAWHIQCTEMAEASKDWFAAEFHLRRLLTASPNDSIMEARRQKAIQLQRSIIANLQSQLGLAQAMNHPTDSPVESYALARQRLQRLNESIWEKVKQAPADNTAPVSNDEVSQLHHALALYPSGTAFNTLAVAEYRRGNYEASITAAINSITLTPEERGLPGAHPIDMAVMAMSHFKLGNPVKAGKYREYFERAMSTGYWKDNKACLGFWAEIRETMSASK